MLTQRGLALTPAEAKIAQVLPGDYPVAGLGTATALARRAGVSDPSVIRGDLRVFPDLKARYRSEHTGRASPFDMVFGNIVVLNGSPWNCIDVIRSPCN